MAFDLNTIILSLNVPLYIEIIISLFQPRFLKNIYEYVFRFKLS